MGTSFEQLAKIDDSRGSKVAIDARTEKDIREMKALKRADADREKRQSRERQVTAQANARIEQRERQYGTTDPDKVRAAEGFTLTDVGALPKLAKSTSPEYALGQLDQFEQATGAGASRDAVQGPERPFFVGKGAADEPYFTNLTRGELHEDARAADAIRESANMPGREGPPVRDLKRLNVGNTLLSGGGDVRSAKEKALDRRLEVTRQAINAPEERAAAEREYGAGLETFAKTFGLGATRKRVTKDVEGRALPTGVSPAAAQFIEADLVKRGASEEELAQDRSGLGLPWVQPKPGKTNDPERLKTMLNPGGAMTREEQVNHRAEATISGLLGEIAGDTPKEVQTTYQLAQQRRDRPARPQVMGPPAPRREKKHKGLPWPFAGAGY